MADSEAFGNHYLVVRFESSCFKETKKTSRLRREHGLRTNLCGYSLLTVMKCLADSDK